MIFSFPWHPIVGGTLLFKYLVSACQLWHNIANIQRYIFKLAERSVFGSALDTWNGSEETMRGGLRWSTWTLISRWGQAALAVIR